MRRRRRREETKKRPPPPRTPSRRARADEASRRGRSVADLFVVLDAFALAPLEEALKRLLPFLERHDAGRRPEMMALRRSQEQLTKCGPARIEHPRVQYTTEELGRSEARSR